MCGPKNPATTMNDIVGFVAPYVWTYGAEMPANPDAWLGDPAVCRSVIDALQNSNNVNSLRDLHASVDAPPPDTIMMRVRGAWKRVAIKPTACTTADDIVPCGNDGCVVNVILNALSG